MQWTLRQWRRRVPWVEFARRIVDDVGASNVDRRPHTAFILPGGGARGAAQAGALGVLLRAGITPDLIIASSAGSWNGAYLAQHPTLAGIHDLEGFWTETTSHDILGASRLRPALNVLGRRGAVFGTANMAQVARHHLGATTFADCAVPLRIIAADLTTGEPHFFTEGQLVDAVLASSAMPGVFPPVMIDGETYVDGGIVDWAGCLAALDAGVSRICLITCGSRSLRPASRRQTFRHVFERSMEVSTRDGFERTLFALRAAGVDVLAIHPDLGDYGLLDFNHAPALITAGRRAAEVAVANWSAATSLVARPSRAFAPLAWLRSHRPIAAQARA